MDSLMFVIVLLVVLTMNVSFVGSKFTNNKQAAALSFLYTNGDLFDDGVGYDDYDGLYSMDEEEDDDDDDDEDEDEDTRVIAGSPTPKPTSGKTCKTAKLKVYNAFVVKEWKVVVEYGGQTYSKKYPPLETKTISFPVCVSDSSISKVEAYVDFQMHSCWKNDNQPWYCFDSCCTNGFRSQTSGYKNIDLDGTTEKTITDGAWAEAWSKW